MGPLMESIGAWRFIRNIDDHCFPSDEHVVVRVWFELPEGHPKVSATIEKAPELGKDLKPLSCPSPSYPYQALNNHPWAIVFASSDLAADGTVTGVMARAYPNVERDADAFASSVKKALSGCRYPSTDSGHRRRACTEVVFNLGG